MSYRKQQKHNDLCENNIDNAKRASELGMMSVADHPDFAEMCRDHLIIDKCLLSRQFIAWQIEALRTYNQTLEDLIASEDSRMAASYSGPPEAYLNWWIEDVVARQLRQSFVAACLDTTTYHLNHVCENVATILRLTSPNLNSNAINKAKSFLRDKAGFVDPPTGDWKEMKALYDFRNSVVHNGALMPGGKRGKQIEGLLQRAPGITLQSGRFELRPEFTAYVHERVSDFFKKLDRELVNLCLRSDVTKGGETRTKLWTAGL